MTPLMLAVKRKKTRIQEKIKIIDQLMEQGADITIQTVCVLHNIVERPMVDPPK